MTVAGVPVAEAGAAEVVGTAAAGAGVVGTAGTTTVPVAVGAVASGAAPGSCSARCARNAAPVWLRRRRAIASGRPFATTRPPPLPPSGPRSMIQSAAAMTSR